MRIIVALDVPSLHAAVALAQRLDPTKCRLKVGKELFTAAGPAVVEALMKLGFEVFLDLKFHDIPNTVAGAIRSACSLGVWMVNVHCLGGRKMMAAAIGETSKSSSGPLVVGVTVLTSLEQSDLAELGFTVTETPAELVLRLATLAQDCGLHGVVCSGQEVAMLRRHIHPNFKLITPGIRLPEGSVDDQARIMTPEKAILAGADYLVVGRPITGANDPIVALDNFNQRVYSALCG